MGAVLSVRVIAINININIITAAGRAARATTPSRPPSMSPQKHWEQPAALQDGSSRSNLRFSRLTNLKRAS